jgi:excisionase family DNA binding protein
VKPEIYQSISVLLQSDNTVPDMQRQQILKVCRRESVKAKRRFGTVKQAAELLSCHPKTVYRYVKRGMLHPVHHSPRRVRFDLDEVEAFANEGTDVADRQDTVEQVQTA